MPVSETDMSGLWRKFASSVGTDPEEPSPDGNYQIAFTDGLEFSLRPWRGEAVFIGKIVDFSSEPGEVEATAKSFMQISLAKAVDWDECIYSENQAFYLWRRFRDAADDDFSVAGIEKFLNRLDFWKRQASSFATRSKRMSGGGAFIAFDQFG